MAPSAPPHAVFVLPRDGAEGAFFDLPWPTNLRKTADGDIDVRDFPNPRHAVTVSDYIDAISTHLTGWGLNGAAYFRFSTSVDPSSLPDTPTATIADGASVFLMDIDPDSPDLGTRHPCVVRYEDEATSYWAAHTVAIRPVFGIPLAPARHYVAVVTKGVLPAAGGTFARDDDFAALADGMGGDATVRAARDTYGAALDALATAGVSRDDVLAIAPFTTQDPTADMKTARDWVMDHYTAPDAMSSAWRFASHRGGYSLMTGRYGPSPIFQKGTSPYNTPGSGGIDFEGGAPVVQDEIDLRFALTIPDGDMPAAGWPLVLYSDGTYGDYESFVNNGEAQELSSVGLAVISIDSVFNGERNPTGGDSGALLFNFANPLAARDNLIQSALDEVQLARFAKRVQIPAATLPPAADGSLIHFDPARIYYLGHSQGSLNGALFLAVDDQTKGGLLSGAAGTFALAILYKTEPYVLIDFVALLLNLPGGSVSALTAEHFGPEHPATTLFATWLEASDPVNYASLWFASPRPGFAPKSILQTEGLRDTEAPPLGIESLAAAAHIPIVKPIAQPIDALALEGIAPVDAPVSGDVAGGAATAGLSQYPADDHFAIFEDDAAKARVRTFFQTLAAGAPQIE